MSENSFTSRHTLNEFKQAVKEWLALEVDVSNVQKIIREKRKRMQNLSDFISTYMKENDKEICDVGDNNALVLKRKKTTGGLKKEHIMKVLSELIINDDERVKEYTNKMYELREVKEKDCVKKTSL